MSVNEVAAGRICFPAAVVGLGRIGQGYDYDVSVGAGPVLTHANAFASHSGFDLVAGVDPSAAERARFELKFGVPAFDSIEAMQRHVNPSVVALCVPTANHMEALELLLQKPLRAVLCEKPIAATYAEAKRMTACAKRADCVLLVNYMRRFEPGVLALKQALAEGCCGDLYKGVVWYSKGFLNNASHFVDLLRFLLGEVGEIELIHAGRVWAGVDPEPDVRIRFGDCDVHFLAAREECFSLACVELVGTGGFVHYLDSGERIEMRQVVPDPDYPGYLKLSDTARQVATDFRRYQWWVAEHLYRHLVDGTALYSDGETASQTLETVERVLNLTKG